MEQNTSSQAEINSPLNTSITYSDKKRKLQDEQLEMPLTKHVCRDSDSISEPTKQQESHEYADSDPESTNSNSFHCNSDSIMSANDVDCSETCASDEPSTSSANSAGTSEISLYSSDIRSLTNSSSTEPESLEFGFHSDFGLSDYADEDLQSPLCPNRGAPSSNYVLSSGRWNVNEDANKESKKPTIDKEFEQYFSMLML